MKGKLTVLVARKDTVTVEPTNDIVVVCPVTVAFVFAVPTITLLLLYGSVQVNGLNTDILAVVGA